MRLKSWLTGLVIFDILMLLGWPLIFRTGLPAGHEAKVRYALVLGLYMGVLLLAFVATAWVSMLILRRLRAELREQSMENVKHLIESTLEDHRKKEDANG